MRKLSIAILAVLILSLVCIPAYADKGGNGKAKGHGPEADYCTGQPDDSCINKGRKSSDMVNNDDTRTSGIQRPYAPSPAAAIHSNCDNNGFDCNVEPPQSSGGGEPGGGGGDEPGGGGSTGNPEEPQIETRRICWHSSQSAVEVWDDATAFYAYNELGIIGEAWNRYCWDAVLGTTYYVRPWNQLIGHSGPEYSVKVTEYGPTLHIHNPFTGAMDLGGALAVRLNEETSMNFSPF